MKLLRPLLIAAATLALSSPVFAQSSSKTVSVSATLTSVCRFQSDAETLVLSVNYTAFGAQQTATDSAAIECTRGITPSFAFDTDPNLVAGLAYTLGTVFTPGAAGEDPGVGSGGALGTPRTGSVAVTATFAAGQPGSTGTASQSKTLTVSF